MTKRHMARRTLATGLFSTVGAAACLGLAPVPACPPFALLCP
jgi:hypothetical protein